MRGCFNHGMGKGFYISGIDRFRSDQRATAAVEFAMLCPLYLLLIMGMSAYGIYFGASHSVQQLSADAARSAVAGVSSSERETLASGFIARNAAGYPFIDPDRLSVEVGDSPTDSNQFDVTVSYEASHLPIWNLFDRLPMPDQTIRRRATVRIGGV